MGRRGACSEEWQTNDRALDCAPAEALEEVLRPGFVHASPTTSCLRNPRPPAPRTTTVLSSEHEPAALAESTPAASSAASLPDDAAVARAEEFVREAFVLPGEDPAEALGPHSPRRWALDAALAELDEG